MTTRKNACPRARALPVDAHHTAGLEQLRRRAPALLQQRGHTCQARSLGLRAKVDGSEVFSRPRACRVRQDQMRAKCVYAPAWLCTHTRSKKRGIERGKGGAHTRAPRTHAHTHTLTHARTQIWSCTRYLILKYRAMVSGFSHSARAGPSQNVRSDSGFGLMLASYLAPMASVLPLS